MEQENNKDHLLTYISVPLIVWEAKNLKPNEKMIITDIIGLIKVYKECFKSNKAFSKVIGVSSDRITKILSDLVKKNYINIRFEKINTSTNQTKRIITLTETFRKELLGGLAYNDSKHSMPKEQETPSQKQLPPLVENNYPPSQKQLPPLGINAEQKKSIKKSIKKPIKNYSENEFSEQSLELFPKEKIGDRLLLESIEFNQSLDDTGTGKKIIGLTREETVYIYDNITERFSKFYKSIFGYDIAYKGKDNAALYAIATDLHHSMLSMKDFVYNPTIDYFIDLLYVFLTKSYDTDDFIRNNYELSIILSKFRTIFNKLIDNKNAKSKINNQPNQRSGVTNFKFNIPDPRERYKENRSF